MTNQEYKEKIHNMERKCIIFVTKSNGDPVKIRKAIRERDIAIRDLKEELRIGKI